MFDSNNPLFPSLNPSFGGEDDSEKFCRIPPHYTDYISLKGCQEIQTLLPRTKGILTPSKLDEIINIPANNLSFPPNLRALGPKTDPGLIDWYEKNFLPLAEGSHQYLYADSELKLTTGMGINLAAGDDSYKPDRLSIFEYKTTKAGKYHYSAVKPKLKSKRVAEFDPKLFLNDQDYQNAIVDKLLIVFKTFYIGKPLDIKRDRYLSSTKASRSQIIAALKHISHLILQEQEKKEDAKKAHKHYSGLIWRAYVSDKNAIYIYKPETDKWTQDFLEHEMIDLHSKIPNFSNFPAGAQLGLMEMLYNLGDTKLQNTFHHFYTEVTQKAVDWQTILINREYHRRGIPEERNIATQILFMLADEWQKTLPFTPARL